MSQSPNLGIELPDSCKIVIAGSRDITDMNLLCAVVHESGYWGMITEIISGHAKGIDTLGEQLAQHYGIPLVIMPANWDRHGRAAGPIRNEAMAHYCDAGIIIRKAAIASRGTTSMMKIMQSLNKPFHLKEV